MLIRKSFTINPNRTKDEIIEFKKKLVDTNIYSGCEFFFPYNISEEKKVEYFKAVNEIACNNQIEMICHLPYGALNNIATNVDLESTMNRFFDAIDFAHSLKAIKCTLHPGELDGTLSRDSAIALSIKNIQILCDYANKYNMIIMIENLIGKNELCRNVEEYFFLKKHINRSNQKFIFDCAHYFCSTIDKVKDIPLFINSVKEDLYHLHISDNNGITDQHGKIGSGCIDFYHYFKALHAINYQGLLSSEVLFHTANDLLETSNTIDNIIKDI